MNRRGRRVLAVDARVTGNFLSVRNKYYKYSLSTLRAVLSRWARSDLSAGRTGTRDGKFSTGISVTEENVST